MAIEDEHVGRTDDRDSSARAALEIEFRSAERQTIASFRESFLRWLNDRSGPLTRTLGAPERLTLDEVPRDGTHGTQTLRLRVTWPAGRSVPQAVLLRAAASKPGTDAVPAPAPPGPVELDQFVFFPDPVEAEAPIFGDLSVPLGPSVLVPAPGAPRLRLERPAGAARLRRAAAFAGAVQAFVARTAGGVSLSRLTMRMPAFTYPRGVRLAALGTAAVAAGFVAGTIYLTTTARRDTTATVAQAAAPRPEPVAVAAAVPHPELLPARQADVPPPAPPIEAAARPATAEHVERGSRPAPLAVSAAAGIPDTVVTPAPRLRPGATRPAAMRQAGPVVVSAHADATASAVMVGGRRVLGALLVRSEPQGAEVSINGVVHGRTPLLIRGVGAGSRVVRLALPGYERWSWAVAVAGDRQTPVNVKLQPAVRGSGDQHD